MKKLAIGLIVAFPIALLGWACCLILFAPPELPLGWTPHTAAAVHDAQAALLGHLYRVAAYAITWAVQLGYAAWLGLKWQAQKRGAARASRCPR
jgi:hypothetical protein